MSKFRSIIQNKKILLLGPAPHVFKKERTEDYREFEVIVKVNKMVEKAEFSCDDLNSRNDVLYHCMQIDLQNGDDPYSIKEWATKKVKHVRLPFTGTDFHYKRNNNRFIKANKSYGLEFSLSPLKVFNDSVKGCDYTLPSTGILAINDLTYYGPKVLDIRGFTFGKTGYSNKYKNQTWHNNKKNRQTTSKHNVQKQIVFFKQILKNNNNIIIDKEMEISINE